MTRDQLHIAFKIAMDKNSQNIAFGGYPAFLPEEIDYWLNQGMYQEVSNKFTGLNTLKQPFEKSVKRIHDLENLIETENISLNKDQIFNMCVATDAFKNKMFYVDCVLKFENSVSTVTLVDHASASKFKSTYNNLPYIETPVAVIEGNDLIIYFDPVSMKANTYFAQITYVKNPTKVEDLTDPQYSEFPEYMWNEIVNRAVALALENIESGRATIKSQFNQIDE